MVNVRCVLVHESQPILFIWACSWDYGTYHIRYQGRLRWACTSVQSRQSLRCSQTWSAEVDKGPTKNQTSSPIGWLCMHVGRMSLLNLVRWLICLFDTQSINASGALKFTACHSQLTMYFIRLLPYDIINISLQSKKISNDQELIQSDPTSCPQNQKGNN